MTSATGILIQTPISPKMFGKISRQGIRNNNCRVRDKKIAFLPYLWIEKTGSNHLEAYGRKECQYDPESSRCNVDQFFFRCKEVDHRSGKNWQMRNPVVATPTAHPIV